VRRAAGGHHSPRCPAAPTPPEAGHLEAGAGGSPARRMRIATPLRSRWVRSSSTAQKPIRSLVALPGLGWRLGGLAVAARRLPSGWPCQALAQNTLPPTQCQNGGVERGGSAVPQALAARVEPLGKQNLHIRQMLSFLGEPRRRSAASGNGKPERWCLLLQPKAGRARCNAAPGDRLPSSCGRPSGGL